jgi:translation initiation factor 1
LKKPPKSKGGFEDPKGAGQPFHNPFAKLGGSTRLTPSGSPASAPNEGPAQAVVRFERKGRGGKEVTLIEQLGLPAAELEAWLKDLKSALGCGGVVEGDALVLQGDHRARVSALLSRRGVRRVRGDFPPT